MSLAAGSFRCGVLELGLFWLALGCGERDSFHLGRPEEIDLAVVVHRRASGFQVLGLVAYEGERVLRAPKAALIEDSPDERIELVGWTKEELLQRVPELSPEAWWQAEVTEAEPACPEGAAQADGGYRVGLAGLEPRSFAVRPESSRLEALAPSPALLDELSIQIPAPHRLCRAPSSARVVALPDLILPPGAVLAGRVIGQPRDPISSFATSFGSTGSVSWSRATP